jgi:hypothetical protein
MNWLNYSYLVDTNTFRCCHSSLYIQYKCEPQHSHMRIHREKNLFYDINNSKGTWINQSFCSTSHNKQRLYILHYRIVITTSVNIISDYLLYFLSILDRSDSQKTTRKNQSISEGLAVYACTFYLFIYFKYNYFKATDWHLYIAIYTHKAH